MAKYIAWIDGVNQHGEPEGGSAVWHDECAPETFVAKLWEKDGEFAGTVAAPIPYAGHDGPLPIPCASCSKDVEA